MAPLTVCNYIRVLYPLAATGAYPSFPPMPPDATLFLPPRPKGRKVRYLHPISATTARNDGRAPFAPSMKIANKELGPLLDKVNGWIAQDELLSSRTTRPQKGYIAKRIVSSFIEGSEGSGEEEQE